MKELYDVINTLPGGRCRPEQSFRYKEYKQFAEDQEERNSWSEQSEDLLSIPTDFTGH